MLSLGPIAFAAPWLLLGLAGLPVLWWLLRVTPPAPRRLDFPAIRLILALRKREETPARTPLWLIILRMILAALVILAVAHPLLNPGARLFGSGPVLLVVDDGWAAARHWAEREHAMNAVIDQAERQNRPIVLATTAPPATGERLRASGLLNAEAAREAANAIKPKPWPTDHAAALEALRDLPAGIGDGSAYAVWLSGGLADDNARALAEHLQRRGGLEVFTDGRGAMGRMILPPRAEGGKLAVPVVRPEGAGEAVLAVRAVAGDGRLLARETIRLEDGKTEGEAVFTLPGEVRNSITRLEIEGEASAAATFLVDERWRRRPVGLVSSGGPENAQPLLSELYYIDRGLSPFAEVRQGTIESLLQRDLAVLVLADIGKLTDTQTATLTGWVERGGVVLRFAGPHMAESVDSLVPVRLRGGGRALGGVMSWSRPATLTPFEESSPFFGLTVPPDVTIQRQVLAEPALDLESKTWARLTDGTPLVTAEKRGRGWVVLIHTTANAEWTNLPLSGLFIRMLERIVGLSQGVGGGATGAVLQPLETLDGFGRATAPSTAATSIAGKEFATTRVRPDHPPGFYGAEGSRRALNLSPGLEKPKRMGALPEGVTVRNFPATGEVDIKPWLLLIALLIALADVVIGFALRGLIPLPRRAAAVVALGLIGAAAGGMDASAQQRDNIDFALKATLETRLAYVETGVPAIDRTSRAGLTGLSQMLKRRTAVEPGDPMGVNVERDELAFFPMLYWPISPRQPPLSEDALAKINNYFRTGGTILFDTREQGQPMAEFGGGGPAAQRLRFLLRRLDIPALLPVPDDHVLTKTFYLLNGFPGRWTGGQVWVERRGGRHNDGVSSVIIGSHDWAAAWAVDAGGQSMFAVVPGGEHQREMAYRFGINWVMYALTGNYKTDQVHVPAIMERLGQ